MFKELKDLYNMIGDVDRNVMISNLHYNSVNLADASNVELASNQKLFIDLFTSRLLDFKGEWDGIVTGSGTEANELALLLARNKSGRNKILVSSICHDSIIRAAQKLSMEVVVLKVEDKSYTVTSKELKRSITDNSSELALVVLTHGVTSLGIPADLIVNKDIDNILEENGIGLHIDAAYGGIMHSLQPKYRDWSIYSSLQTVTVDAHKYTGVLGCGLLLVKNPSDSRYLGSESTYFPGNKTVIGTSRSAFPMMVALRSIESKSTEEHQAIIAECNNRAAQLAKNLDQIGFTNLVSIESGVVPIKSNSIEERDKICEFFLINGYKVSKICIKTKSQEVYGWRVVITTKPDVSRTEISKFYEVAKRYQDHLANTSRLTTNI